MRILLVDDEELARAKLRDLIQDIPGVEVCGEAENGEDAVTKIKELKPDLILLDIQMPGLDGFGVLKNLKNPPLIIFTTAYDQYAVKAFEIESVDYLLKPFGKTRLQQAIDRAKSRFSEKITPAMNINHLIEQIKNPGKQYRTKFSSMKRGSVIFLTTQEITHFRLDDTILFAYTKSNRHPIKGTVDNLETELDPNQFFRCHRSVIVNLNMIREVRQLFKDNYEIVLNDSDSTILPLSRRRAKILKEKIPW
jgi:two-component system LytT family response regulator